MDRARKRPTLADLDALPPGQKGEIIEGVLYARTRPRSRHQNANGGIVDELRSPFQRGRGGPGGWWILTEPGIELPDAPEVSPDVAGWRRERMPELPADGPIRVAPDWVCEILFTTTRRHDLVVKKPYYARIGLPYRWLVDSDAQALTAHRLENGHWVDLGTWADETDARVEPFDAVPLDVKSFWP